ncbi:Mammalian cell entry related domain protein [Mycobacterium sp. Marseille-P9652]|uniref:Mammalian cell entry related domain protein n=1 Tax=Mycobacterium sp. Marseille-P9652 TaxID=2654950 RepID=UPI001E480F93|nr:Mammalian cell entry related domain protein [Mycobacterium sp. Marseille-P9652]
MVVGALTILCASVVAAIVAFSPSGGRPHDRITVALDTPFVGQGVRAGTAIVMHGVEVGRVTSISSLPGGGIRLLSDLQRSSVAGLTDTLKVEFRPINYFGVTGVDLQAGLGGRQLRDGMRIGVAPEQNSTLQALLSRLGEVSVGTLTPQLISVIDRVGQYTNALTPLLETVVITLQAVAHVQTVPAARLLANATGISVVVPGFVQGIVTAGDGFIDDLLGLSKDDFYGPNGLRIANEVGSTEVFSGFGRLEANYVDDLLPLIDGNKALFDPIPALFRPDDFATTLVQLRERFEKMFAGNGEQRALQVRIVLDSLPGVAAGLGGAPQVPSDEPQGSQ